MGIFTRLYEHITGKGTKPAPRGPAPTPAAAKTERIRQTAADEYASRTAAKDREIAGSLASIKERIARESAEILKSLGQKEMSAFEEDLAQRRKKGAQLEKRIAETPEERFLAGSLKLRYGVDFQSINPAKPSVYAVQYAPDTEEMFVQFWTNERGGKTPGPTYRYWKVTRGEARAMWMAHSKGVNVWDQFRVRGSRTLHKKSYAKVSSGGAFG